MREFFQEVAYATKGTWEVSRANGHSVWTFLRHLPRCVAKYLVLHYFGEVQLKVRPYGTNPLKKRKRRK